MVFNKLIYILLILSATLCHAQRIDISGAGATFPAPIYIRWAELYEKQTQVRINYQPIGSGGGIQQVIAGTVHFGASDKPLSEKELRKNKLVQFPTLLGGVVPVYHIPELGNAPLKMTGELLSEIFLGKVIYWNDPKIQALNPEVLLPAKKITVVHRSDGSGTTFLLTHYLSQISSEWMTKVGSDVAVRWPVGIGGKGNDGIVVFIKQIPYSIGYVEYSYVCMHHLQFTKLKNSADNFIEPSIESITAAAKDANWQESNLLLNRLELKNVWPITGATFILMRQEINDSNRQETKNILNFINWAFQHGDKEAIKLHFAPLPTSIKKQIFQQWQQEFIDKSLSMTRTIKQ